MIFKYEETQCNNADMEADENNVEDPTACLI